MESVHSKRVTLEVGLFLLQKLPVWREQAESAVEIPCPSFCGNVCYLPLLHPVITDRKVAVFARMACCPGLFSEAGLQKSTPGEIGLICKADAMEMDVIRVLTVGSDGFLCRLSPLVRGGGYQATASWAGQLVVQES